MTTRYESLLPIPTEVDTKKYNPEYAMNELSKSIQSKYGDRIFGSFSTISENGNDNCTILNYTYFLIFPKHDDFYYPLFTARCIEGNGAYPLEVTSHYAPPITHGNVDSYESFSKVIVDILKHERTREIILSLY